MSSFNVLDSTMDSLDGLLAAFSAVVAGGAVASSAITAQAYVFTTGTVDGGLANASGQTFLVLNNGNGAIDSSDFLINITGVTGVIGSANFAYGVV